MQITEVRVKLVGRQNERLKAFCSVTFDGDFVIRDVKSFWIEVRPFESGFLVKGVLKGGFCLFLSWFGELGWISRCFFLSWYGRRIFCWEHFLKELRDNQSSFSNYLFKSQLLSLDKNKNM